MKPLRAESAGVRVESPAIAQGRCRRETKVRDPTSLWALSLAEKALFPETAKLLTVHANL
eukprot:9067982-Pyramimonas_sp.AAC.1